MHTFQASVRTWLLAGLLAASSLAGAAQTRSPWFDARVYSDIQYVREAGELTGVEVVLLPNADGTVQVLWRWVGPNVQPAMLVDAEREMDSPHRLVVDLKERGGRWVLEEKGRTLLGSGPDGRSLRVRRTRG